jgi:hypothetical protein
MTTNSAFTTLSWKRSLVQPNEREDENVGEEFFNDVDTLDEISSLVRESMQNSIDEALSHGKPVKVRFTVGKQSIGMNRNYFDEILSHAEQSLHPNLLPDLNQNSKFLVIEDFNTNGLRGSISSIRPNKEQEEKYGSNYWFFEWKSGETNKISGGRGSWGIGKAVLSAASRLKTILVYSERQDKHCPEKNTTGILFGHSILKYANVDGQRLRPYRNWMSEKEINGQKIHVPSSESSEIRKFSKDWRVSRKQGEFGTSIVIPFVKEAINAKRLTQCIIQDYFIAILDEVVVCEVIDENGHVRHLSKDNLIALIEEMDEDGLTSATKGKDELIGFCKMYQKRIAKSTERHLIRSSFDTINDWSTINFSEDEKKKFESDLEEGRCLEFVVQTEVPTSRVGSHKTDQFYVLFSKLGVEGISKTLFTRRGIIIPEAHRDSKIAGLLSMVIIEEGESNELQQMLRLSEGPAHKNWTPKGDKVHARYDVKALKKTINWVKVSAITLHKKMQPDQNIADDRSLARYFPDEEPLNNSHGDATGEGENVEGTPEGGQGGSGGKGAPRGGRLLRIDSGPTMGSIVLRPIDASKMQIGMKFEIETAYALRGGDSFAAWDMEDFKIVDLYDEKNSSGVEINFSENKAQFVLEQLDFSILFSGFDVNRDLSIDVKRVR